MVLATEQAAPSHRGEGTETMLIVQPRTRFSIRSTCAIGVSGWMP
jgi:hypothetical protein